MQLTKYTDLGFRVLMHLALETEGRTTVSDLAKQYHASKNHLVKVVNRLRAKGYIKSYRGRNGGIYLGKQASSIVVGNVVRDMESTLDIVNCITCPLRPSCQLKLTLNEATTAFLKVLDSYTLADLAKDKRSFLTDPTDNMTAQHQDLSAQ